jgi:FixJ family two-component response regulator
VETFAVSIPLVAVVDNDEALCLSLVELMQSAGYRAEPFASAETFLVSPSLTHFDCVIADVYMPRKGGLELLQDLHEQGIATPVILITAQPSRRLDEEAASTGAYCLLVKPFGVKSLLDCVERSIRHYASLARRQTALPRPCRSRHRD